MKLYTLPNYKQDLQNVNITITLTIIQTQQRKCKGYFSSWFCLSSKQDKTKKNFMTLVQSIFNSDK